MICVPTPLSGEDKNSSADLSYVLEAAADISSVIKPGDIVILESTSPVGTTEKISDIINPGKIDISLAYCPERVLPGQILEELKYNSRIVGGIDQASALVISKFYEKNIDGIVLTSTARTAELSKLVENSYRDINIAFANSISIIADNVGVDPWELIDLANHHPRVDILRPGIGVGGHCIAVDPWFIISSDPENSKLIQSARLENLKKPNYVASEIFANYQKISRDLGREANLTLFGLSYKPDIDDFRESPAIKVLELLQEKNINIQVVEPYMEETEKFKLIEISEALDISDICVVLVRHKQFLKKSVIDHYKMKDAFRFVGGI